MENVLNICFLLEYVYLAHGSRSNVGHGWISIVLSSLRIHMFGCVQILQNDVISLLILCFIFYFIEVLFYCSLLERSL